MRGFRGDDRRQKKSSFLKSALIAAVVFSALLQITTALTIGREIETVQRDRLNDDLQKRAADDPTRNNAQQSAWVAAAVVLAGTASPTVSEIAGAPVSTTTKAVTTTTAIVSTTTKAVSTTTKAITTTTKAITTVQNLVSTTTVTKLAITTSPKPKTTSASTKKSSSSSKKKTSTTSRKTATTSSKKKTSTTSRKKTSTTSTKPRTTTTTAIKTQTTTKLTTTTKISTKVATSTTIRNNNLASPTVTTTKTTTTTPLQTQTWSWAAQAYGCGTATPQGSMILCMATGVSMGARAVQATATPILARDIPELVLRDSTTDNVLGLDVPWLDVVVGAVPYKSGDLIPSIVWIVVTLMLTPLFVLRLIRRSSSIVNILSTIFVWSCAIIVAFGIRLYMSIKAPTTHLMIAENGLLQILPTLVLEPLLCLLAMYAAQNGNKKSSKYFWLLRSLNIAALVLFTVSSVYYGMYIKSWDNALQSNTTSGVNVPAFAPSALIRIAPIVASFLIIIAVTGGVFLIPVARGSNGSMRPGAFLTLLFILVGVSVFYRIFQSLHASSALNEENVGDASSIIARAIEDVFSFTTSQFTAATPTEMFISGMVGIAWKHLQEIQASRGSSQSPLLFNLVYMLPMWLNVVLLFFVHAPSSSALGDDDDEEEAMDADAKLVDEKINLASAA